MDEAVSAAEAALAAMESEAAHLRASLARAADSRWLRLGHRLKLTRSLERIRTELAKPFLQPSLPPSVRQTTEPPEIAAFHAASTARALERIAGRSLEIGTVIDVGASNGMWSAVAEKVFPAARYLLIEAQDYHRAALEAYCREHPLADFVLAAAGDSKGETFFDDRMPFGGVASREATDYAKTRVPMETIDNLVETRRLAGPFLLKLDTHGFEVPILNGAIQTLKAANLVVIEVYNFRLGDGALLFDEMCAFMRQHGFGVIDISEPLWRARDGAFWQMDFFSRRFTEPSLHRMAMIERRCSLCAEQHR